MAAARAFIKITIITSYFFAKGTPFDSRATFCRAASGTHWDFAHKNLGLFGLRFVFTHNS